MYPTIDIFGKTVPSYWVCLLAGISVCSIVAIFRHKRFEELQQVDITNAAALLLVGALIGSRLLYLITIAPILIRNYKILLENHSLAFEILSNGMVFYGGLIGALLILYLYTGKYRLDRKTFFDYFAPLFPLFHSFGRIGCFLTGCCHGRVSEKYGIAFHNSNSALNGIPYFPIQLVCSLGNLILFLVLLYYEKRNHKKGNTMILYLGLYSLGRFILEFFRGDDVRGFLFGISTSQWISIAILIVIAFRKFPALRKSR